MTTWTRTDPLISEKVTVPKIYSLDQHAHSDEDMYIGI